jgi:hypothetical protein
VLVLLLCWKKEEEKGKEEEKDNKEEKRENKGEGVVKGEVEGDSKRRAIAEAEDEDEADDPEDWNEWICEDQTTPPRDDCTPTIPIPTTTPTAIVTPIPATTSTPAATIYTRTQPDKNQNENRTEAQTEKQTQTQTNIQSSTLMKIGCGNLVLSSSGKPLFYFLGDSTVECAMTHVSQDKRAEIAAGDGASFVQLRCEWNEVVQEGVSNQRKEALIVSSTHHNDESLLNNNTDCADNDTMDSSPDTTPSSTSTSTSTTSTMSLFIKLPGRKKAINTTTLPFNNENDNNNSNNNNDNDNDNDDDVMLKTNGAGKNGGTKMSQIVLVPQLMREAVRGMLTELLEGYG